MTDSERFYNSVLDLFEDIEEAEEVNDLLMWWNRYTLIFLAPYNSFLCNWVFQPDLSQLLVGTAPYF